MENKINWFPGHMKSALDMIGAELKLCDVIIYVLDARCPRSCLNPKFEDFTAKKPVLFVYNKADLAPAAKGASCELQVTNGGNQYADTKCSAVALNSTQSGAGQRVTAAVNKILADKIKAMADKGINKTIRAVVIGVTNCGKSTLINNLAGSGKALTGDKPGVTKAKQWVAVNSSRVRGGGGWGLGGFWVLDTPGTLWPKFDDPQIAKNLAYVGSIRDDVLDIVELVKSLITDLERLVPGCVGKRFGANDFEGICKKRGYVLKGGILDEQRAARAILTEFRAGKLGRFNLDMLLPNGYHKK